MDDETRTTIAGWDICKIGAENAGKDLDVDVEVIMPNGGVEQKSKMEDLLSRGVYAIAAAVLGGCSLRGGQGTVVGVVIGAAVMQVLKNRINLVTWIPTHIEFAVVGTVILVAVVADELVKRTVATRRRKF